MSVSGRQLVAGVCGEGDGNGTERLGVAVGVGCDVGWMGGLETEEGLAGCVGWLVGGREWRER